MMGNLGTRHARKPSQFVPVLGRLRLAVLILPLLATSCGWDGHFTVLGYTTRPNYDEGIRTVQVPIFKNNTFRRGIEFDLTRAVVREIEAKTPYKVVSDGCPADTVLTGTIISLNKNLLNRTQLNEVREAETILAVEIVWKDLRSGEILSQPRSATAALPPPGAPTGTPPIPKPVLITSQGHFIPELGQSITTAEQENVNHLAIQIVSMMEKPW